MSIETLETLRLQYFELSKEFLLALQNDQSSEELELIRVKIRDVVSKMEAMESGH